MDFKRYKGKTFMNSLEKSAYEILKKEKRITPALLCRKLKVDIQSAQELCHSAYSYQCRDFFYIRRYGMSMEEFEKMCQNEVETTTKNMGIN